MADDNLSTASGPILVQKKVTKENVTVCVRVRPLNRLEQRTGQKEAWTIDPRTQSITQSHFPNELAKKASQTKEIPSFAFDYVFTPDQDNLYVYDKIGFPLVLSVMEGFHGCVFAYGQTSSGKTHTIHGSPTAPGMIPQAIETVFGYIEEHSEREFVLRVSYMEIYNEIVNDLLNPANTNLRIREDVKRGVFVEGLKEDIVMTDDQVFSLLQAGTSHRHIGRTNYNDVSSRSHTVFRVVIESSPRGKARGGVRVSTLNLVDLAGSENAVKAGSDARVKETGYINKSLLTLGHVIFKLSENNLEHIPYRDSKLTRILQSSLSGKSKISVVCNVSPSSGNIEESLSTLKFAARAKKIVNNATVNERLDSETLLRKYRDEIDQLKRELLEAREASKVSAESKLRDEETYALMEKNEQEKMALNAKIEQLTRLILTSSQARPIIQEPLAPPEAAAAPDAPSPTASGPETSRSTDSTAPSITVSDSSEGSTPASSAAASVEKPKPNATLRLPGRSSGGKSATIYGTLPRGFNLANVPMARRHSLKDMQKAIDELVRRSGGDDDLDCPVPAPAVISADADPNDTVESLRAKLAKVSQDLKVTKAQLEESKQQNEILQRELEEKNTLLQEWDTYYVTNSNKTSAITNELRRVAAKTNNDELRELFHSLDMDQDDFNAPLVDLSSGGLTSSTSEQTLARPPSGTQKTPDRNKFMGLMSRWKSIEQDMDK